MIARRLRPLALVATAAAGAALMVGAAGCGSDSSSSGNSTTEATTAAATTDTTGHAATDGPVVAVTEGTPQEFSLVPAQNSAAAGKVTFRVTNSGAMVHEFVVIKTDKTAATLPTEKDGSAKEDGSVGEIPDMAAGTTHSLTLNLKAGHYALICNLPGHYAGGMRADFTVK